MAVAQTSVKQLDDITMCPLCEQLLTDPDVLPCFHAYCSSCLDDWYRDRGHANDRGHCPLCNTAYMFFPRESVEMLKNRFVVKLLDLKRILSSDDVLCVLCLSEKIRENGAAVHKTATMYCIDCRQNYCDNCIATHEIINPLVCHRIIERGKPRPIKELMVSSSLDRCDTHVDKQLEVYCKICKKAICFLCSVETPHHTHDRIQVDTVLESLRNGITKDINSISTGIAACHTVRGNLQKIADDFSQHVGLIKTNIERITDELRNRIDEDEERMLTNLALVRQNGAGRFSKDKQEIEHYLSALLILKKYLIAVKDNGTACDVASLAEPLRARTADLRKFDVTKRIKLASNTMVVSFVPGFGRRYAGNVLGSIEEKTVYKGLHCHTGVAGGGHGVSGQDPKVKIHTL